jgi:hypothetical protein
MAKQIISPPLLEIQFAINDVNYLVSTMASLFFMIASFIPSCIISIGQKLMCPIELQSLIVSWTSQTPYIKAKLKTNSNKVSSPCFTEF